MKWLFFVLLMVNVGLVAVQWVQHRERAIIPEFKEDLKASRIILLSDSSNDSSGVDGAKRRCVILGAFSSGDSIKVGIDKWSVDKRFVRVVEQVEKRASSYWVYIFKDDVGDSMLSILKKLGVDTYKIATGELAGGYSLGVFENIDLAKNLVKKVKSEGLSSRIYEKPRQELSYWLEYELDYAAENQQKIKEITDILPKGVKKREIFCKSVASEK